MAAAASSASIACNLESDNISFHLSDTCCVSIPLATLYRSKTLSDTIAANGDAQFVIVAPAGYIEAWLECMKLFSAEQNELSHVDNDKMMQYLLAADFVADTEAIDGVATALSLRLFSVASQPDDLLDTTRARIEVLKDRLPLELLALVIKASPLSIDYLSAHLPQDLRLHAFEAAFPGVTTGALELDCRDHALMTCTAALEAFASQQPPSRLVITIAESLHVVSEVHASFMTALIGAVMAGPEVLSLVLHDSLPHLISAGVRVIPDALQQCTRLKRLTIQLPGLLDSAAEPVTIADALPHLTNLQHLHLVVPLFDVEDSNYMACVVAHLTQLTSCHLQVGGVTAPIARALSRIPSMQSLRWDVEQIPRNIDTMLPDGSNLPAITSFGDLRLSFTNSSGVAVEADRRQSILSAAVPALTSLRSLDVSQMAQTTADVRLLVQSLPAVTQLESLKVCASAQPASVISLLKALAGVTTCTEVALSGYLQREADGRCCCTRMFAGLCGLSELRTLEWSMGASSCECFNTRGSYVPPGPTLPCLEQLHYRSRSPRGNGGLLCSLLLSQRGSPRFQQVSLSTAQLPEEAARKVVEALTELPRLVHFSLTSCSILEPINVISSFSAFSRSVEGRQLPASWCSALGRCPHLDTLHIRYMGLSSEASSALAASFVTLTDLKSLRIVQELEPVHPLHLVESLSALTDLTELWLCGVDLTEDAASALVMSLGRLSRLRVLHLDNVHVGMPGLRGICGVLCSIPRLRSIRLPGVARCHEGALVVAEVLRKAASVRDVLLLVDENSETLSEAGYAAIRDALGVHGDPTRCPALAQMCGVAMFA